MAKSKIIVFNMEESERSKHQKSNSDYSSENDGSWDDMVKSPDDGELLDKKIIVDSAEDSENNEYDNESYGGRSNESLQKSNISNPNDIDYNRLDENYLTNLSKKSNSIRSLEMMNQRPGQFSKKSFNSNRSLIKNIYYPTMSAGNRSQKSEPVRNGNKNVRDNRHLSLPDIQRNKAKRATATFNQSKGSKNTSNSKQAKKLAKNREGGHSYISFNSANRKDRNKTYEENEPRSHKLDFTQKSVLNTEKEKKRMNETFESWTTEGKKTSIIPGLASTNKIAEEAYGGNSVQSHKSYVSKKSRSGQHKSSNKRSQSLHSKNGSETIGDDSLPELANSVVEDSMPFKGLENHHKAISKEGFSGANDTNYMQKTNENFYSSFKSKQTENINMAPLNIKENGFPFINSRDKLANQTEIYDDNSDLERIQNSNSKSLSGSPLNLKKAGQANMLNSTEQPTFRSNTGIVINSKRSKNKSKRSKVNQILMKEGEKKKPGTQNYYAGKDTNMAIIPNSDIMNLQNLQHFNGERFDSLEDGNFLNKTFLILI